MSTFNILRSSVLTIETTADGLHYLSNNFVLLLPRDKALEVINSLVSFYDRYDQEAIDQSNDEIMVRPEHNAPPYSPRPKLKTRRPGYVYLLKAEKGYKIGLSKTPLKRIKTMAVKLPFPIEIICLIETEDMVQLEAQLHQRFAEKRLGGEWFSLDQEDVEYIKGLAE